jgi:hypothetical protein
MPSYTITLGLSKRRQRAQVLNDALPGIVLFFVGLRAFINNGLTYDPMPYIGVIVGVVVMRSALEELWSHHTSKQRNWFDISSGIVIVIEAASQYKSYKGLQPAHLLILVGVLTILRGLFADKIPQLQRVMITDDSFFARKSLLSSVSLKWNDFTRIHRAPAALSFDLKKGSKVLSLRHMENRSEVINRTVESALAHGIEIAEGF